jgi:hypothetical protein
MRFTSGFPRLAASIILSLLASVLIADAESSIRFTWAFVYQGKDQQVRGIDYSETIARLQSGDRFKMYFKPSSPCRVYMYLHDAQENLHPLFMETTQVGKSCSLPQGEDWFYLDEQGGTELFYLIVSAHRLRKLEALTKEFSALEVSGSERFLTQKYKVLDEIKRIIKQSSSLADVAQRPVPVAGDLRGITEEIQVLGIGVEAKSIYVKTVRLEH